MGIEVKNRKEDWLEYMLPDPIDPKTPGFVNVDGTPWTKEQIADYMEVEKKKVEEKVSELAGTKTTVKPEDKELIKTFFQALELRDPSVTPLNIEYLKNHIKRNVSKDIELSIKGGSILVNGARTKISFSTLSDAYTALKLLVEPEDAQHFVASALAKKLSKIFC